MCTINAIISVHVEFITDFDVFRKSFNSVRFRTESEIFIAKISCRIFFCLAENSRFIIITIVYDDNEDSFTYFL